MNYSILKNYTALFICGLAILFSLHAKAQTYPTTSIFSASTINTLQLYTSANTIWVRDTIYYYNNPNNHGNIGYLQTDHWVTNDGQQWNFYEQEKNRSVLTISFSGSTIPSDATINGIQIALTSATNGSLTATIGKLADGNITVNKAGWDKFTSGSNTIYDNSIAYNTSTPVNVTSGSSLWDAIIAAHSAKTTMNIFARSNYEGNGTSNATISAAIYVLWTPKISVTVQNAIGGSPSKVNIDGYEYAAPKTSTWDAGSPHTLLGWDQTISGLTYPFLSWTNVTAGGTTIPGNPINISPTNNTTFQANYGPGVVMTTVDQKLSNSVSTGQVGLWEGSSFTNHSVPVGRAYSPSSNQVLRGTQDILSNEKYNYWTTGINNVIESDINNHRSFTISTSISPIISRLKPTVDGTSFAVTLEGTSVSDSVRFMDPWLTDYTDSYGTRNQGMSAPFKKVTTGGNPLGTGTSYKGVLLNQTTPVTYSVQAPSPKTIGGTTSYFLNWNVGSGANVTQPSSATSPVVFTAANATVTANYKGTHITGVSNTLSNTSQRKTIRTEDGYLFLTYESMNRIWLERSVDGGTTWSICNNGPIDNGPEAKHPSIDYLTGQTYYNDQNEIFVSYQQKTSNGSYTIQLARFNNAGQKQSDHTIYTSPSSYSNNATPVIAVTWYYRNEWRKQVVGIWKEPTASGVTAGLRWYGAYYVGSSFNWNNTELHYETITYTDAQSKNPTIDVYKYDNAARLNTLNYHIAWEQPYSSYTAIKYYKVLCGYSGLSLTGHLTPSSGDGYVYNLRPSITTVSNTASRLCWVGRFEMPDDIDEFSRTIFTDPANGGVFWNFGGYVTASNISKNYDDLYGTTGYSIGWTQLSGSSYSNFAVKNTTLSTPVNLNSSGKDMHLHNSWDFTEQRGITLSTSSPYSFLTTSPVQPPSGGGKELDKKGSVPILSGRMGVVTINDAQFHFMVGDILVNGQPIGFKQMYDTTKINSREDIQSFLISELFTLSGGMEFLYGVQFGVTDSASARELLGKGNNVRFSVDLINASTGSVVGTFDDVTYSESNIIPYSKIGYEVNTDGIASRDVRLRLSATSNLPAQFALSDVQTEYLTLAKNGSERIKRNINGALLVTEYALDQNYPNPFNPTTTISYAIPQDGIVTLNIYDALGREVATLVNEFRKTGRHIAKFDASRLSSGMYIYKITSGKFTDTKKMSFVK